MSSTTTDPAAGQFARAGDRPDHDRSELVTAAEAALLARARQAFQHDDRSRRGQGNGGVGPGSDPVEAAAPPVEPALIGQILVDALTEADDPAGVFAWPGGDALWTNRALDDPAGGASRPFMALLDEWSQARFIVRTLPALLRTGRWRGQLGLLVDAPDAVSMSTMLVAHHDANGELDAFSLVAHRVDDELLAAAPTGQSDNATRMLAALVQHVNDLIIVADTAGGITFASSAATSLLGISEAACPPGGFLHLIHPDDRPADLKALARGDHAEDHERPASEPVRIRVRSLDDSWRLLDVIVTDLSDNPAIGGFVINARDLTDDEHARDAAAAHVVDELTGLPSRIRLIQHLEQLDAHGAAAPGRVALLLVDLDHFRRFNEAHGASQTDAALLAVSRRLVTMDGIGTDPFIARMNSDEFAIVLSDLEGDRDAVTIADRVREEIAGPLYIGTGWEQVTASIGVAVLGFAGTAAGLLTDADWAMHRAKDAGRNRVELHDTKVSAASAPHRVDHQLARALETDGIHLWYQPVFDVLTDRVVAAEALLRVRGEQGELLAPGAFVEAAESHGLIMQLGSSVLRTACREIASRGTEGRDTPCAARTIPVA